MCPNLTEVGSPNGEISFVRNLCDPQINRALCGRTVEMLPLVATNYYFRFC